MIRIEYSVGVMIRIEYSVVCDICKSNCSRKSNSSYSAVQSSIAAGWETASDFYGNAVHCCFACKELPKPDWWPKDRE